MISSSPDQRLMHKTVTLKRNNAQGVIRGYHPASKKWWVAIDLTGNWYAEDEFEVTE